MNIIDTNALLHTLAASGDHVMVSVTLNGAGTGKAVPLSDSPVAAEIALTLVSSAQATADTFDMSADFHVSRDESALGITH